MLLNPPPGDERSLEQDPAHPAGDLPQDGAGLLRPAGLRARPARGTPLLHRREGQGPLDDRTEGEFYK